MQCPLRELNPDLMIRNHAPCPLGQEGYVLRGVTGWNRTTVCVGHNHEPFPTSATATRYVYSGVNWNRTSDFRFFTPALYLLSYHSICLLAHEDLNPDLPGNNRTRCHYAMSHGATRSRTLIHRSKVGALPLEL